MAKLKKELAGSGDFLKAALDANSVQGEVLRKVESECEAFKAKFEASEKEKEKLVVELKRAEDNLAEASSAMMKSCPRRCRWSWR